MLSHQNGTNDVHYDVFCFGVLLYQLVTNTFLDSISWQMTRPEIPSCPSEFKHIIVQCWRSDVKSMPTMQKIVAYIQTVTKFNFKTDLTAQGTIIIAFIVM